MRVGLKLGQEVIAGVIKQVQCGMYEFPKALSLYALEAFSQLCERIGKR